MKQLIIMCMLVLTLSACEFKGLLNTEIEPKEPTNITSTVPPEEMVKLNRYLSNLSQHHFEGYNPEALNHEQLLNLGFWLFAYDEFTDVTLSTINGVFYFEFSYDLMQTKLTDYFDISLDKKAAGQWIYQEESYYYPAVSNAYYLDTVTYVDEMIDHQNESFTISASIYEFEASLVCSPFEQYLEPKATWSHAMKAQIIGTAVIEIAYSEGLEKYVISHYEVSYDEKQNTILPYELN